MIARLKERAAALRQETYALYIAARDPRVPWYARAFMGLVLAYALSPVDLVPDFIPVLGYLDDLILVPLGIALAVRMVPAPVMAEARARAAELARQGQLSSRGGVIIVAVIWLCVLGWAGWLIARAWLAPG